jgi:hypothetical protein
MPSNLSASVNVNNFCAVVWSLGVLGALSCGVNTLMLKQNAGVRPSALHDFFMDGSLEGQPIKVRHEIGIKPCG